MIRWPILVEQRTAKQQNTEPQNFEGWNRYALSFEFIKIDRIHSFDIRYSIFSIRYSLLKSYMRLTRLKSLFRSNRPLRRPALGLNL